MKTFKEHLFEKDTVTDFDKELLMESLSSELTEDEQAKVDEAIDKFVTEYLEKNKNIVDLNNELTNEGFLGSILGGLTGFALGKSIGKIIARVLGVEKGILYDLLTSKLIGAAVGAAVGKKM